ncbi:MAG: pilus (MSHA type) biogenesis protein MshL [Gammaproteobacteria bacterium]|nr:pilus (MSHA type) biogenesis protein MshL [Gammaproteobacteria bacterium]
MTKCTAPWTLLLIALTVGCSHTTRQRNAHHQQLLEESTTDTISAEDPEITLPQEVVAQLQPKLTIPLAAASPVPREQRFDIRANEMAAREFFSALVEGSRYNLIIDPTVSGTLSLDLKNVTLPEVLELVRTIHGYDYAFHDLTIQIFPNTAQTRIFQIDYLSAKRSGNSTTTAGSTSSGSESGANSGTTTIETNNEDSLWADLKSSIEMIITGAAPAKATTTAPKGEEKQEQEAGSSSEEQQVSVNPHTGMIVVKALPSKLRKVAEFLRQSQVKLARQVVIEARILEVELSDQFQSGINWTSLHDFNNTQTLFTQTGGGSVNNGSGATLNAGNQANLVSAGSTGSLSSNVSTFGGVFSVAAKAHSFAAFIELLKTQGEVHVLSNPRVSTLNNQKAVIKVGTDEFFVNGVTTSTNDGVVTPVYELGTFFSGVALDVTPQIDSEGKITLHIHPTVSDVTNQTKNIGALTVPLASSNIREADSVVRARDGEIIVIGGLMQNRTRDGEGKVPVLGDIPLLGKLFTHTVQSQVKSELVILLKPQVISPQGEEWQDQIRATTRSFGQSL